MRIPGPIYRLLRWSEKYTKTDMVYFASSNFWLNMSRVISIGTGMLLTVAFANLLTPETFGTYKYVLASAGLIATFSLNGLMLGLSRAVAQGKFHVIPSVVHTAMFWSLPASIVSFGISGYYFAHGNSDLGFAFLFIAITNSASNGIGMTKGVWQSTGDFRLATLMGLPKIVVPFLIILTAILLTKNVVWILGAYFIGNVTVSWLGYRFMLWWFRVKKSKKDVDEVIKYGKQLSLLGIFQSAGAQIDQLLLWHFATPVALATYALALSPVNEAQNLLGNFVAILFPKMANKSREDAYQSVGLRMTQMFIAACILVAIFIIFVPFLFTYLFPKYQASILISQVLSLTILFQPRAVIDTVFSAHAEMGKRTRVILISQIIDFALLFMLIPAFGLWGAVAATILTEAGTTLVYYVMYRISLKNITHGS
jgi:O-antigen/teichoic acid export membrane protein